MADFTKEKELLRLAVRNTEQLQEVVWEVESKLEADATDAKDLIRPCGILVQRLLEAQAKVEELIQKIYSAGLVEVGVDQR